MRPFLVPALCLGWLGGVLLGSVVSLPVALLNSLGIATAVAFVAGRRSWRIQLAALVVLLGAFGVWRAQGADAVDTAARAVWEPWYGKPMVIRGVADEVQPRGASVRLTVGRLVADGQELPGFLRATVLGLPGLTDNAVVLLRGRLVRPEELLPPNATARGGTERAFARRRVLAAMRFPTAVVERAGNPAILGRVRAHLRSVFLRELPEPAAGFMSALVLSFDADLSRDLRDQAAATGILHLVAISGSHIAVLAAFVFWLATAVGASRLFATGSTLALTAVFLALVGFPESGIRSGIMAGFVLLAYLLGRPAAGVRALLLACALMTVHEPRILLGDVGFQLSALAVWGLLSIYPLLRERFRAVPDPLRVRTLVLLAVSAELATLPVVAYAFGRVSLIGPLTNVFAGYLFVPLLVLGALVLAAGLLVSSPIPLVAPLAAATGNAFLSIAEIGSRLPFHALAVPPVSLSFFLASVGALILAVHLAARRRRAVGA